MNTARLLLLSPNWHPRKMFATGDLGTIQNPSNLPGIYAESNGLTAGAAGSVFGLIIDERYSLARLAELAPAAVDFESAPWTASSATPTANAFTTAGAGGMQATGIASTTKTYEVVMTLANSSTVTLRTASAGPDLASFAAASARQVRAIVLSNGALIYIRNAAAGTTTVTGLSIKEIPGNHALQATADNRPLLVAGGKVDYDGVNDALVTTWASSLGTACTVGRSVPQGEATILTGQTITTTYTDNTDHCGLVIINRALSATETNQLRRWLNRRAG
jgi:hypothetical protein